MIHAERPHSPGANLRVNISYLYLHLRFLPMWCFFPAQLSGARYVVRFIFATHKHTHTHSPHPKCVQLLDATMCSVICSRTNLRQKEGEQRTRNKKSQFAVVTGAFVSCLASLFHHWTPAKLRDARAQLLRVIPSARSACAYAYRSRKEGCVDGIDLSLSISLQSLSISPTSWQKKRAIHEEAMKCV